MTKSQANMSRTSHHQQISIIFHTENHWYITVISSRLSFSFIVLPLYSGWFDMKFYVSIVIFTPEVKKTKASWSGRAKMLCLSNFTFQIIYWRYILLCFLLTFCSFCSIHPKFIITKRSSISRTLDEYAVISNNIKWILLHKFIFSLFFRAFP